MTLIQVEGLQPQKNAGKIRGALRWLKRISGVDRSIAYTILGRSWASIAGLITVLLIAHQLTPVQQGYYYTFGSLVALQVVFELGFSFVILQMASHECAYLTITEDGLVSGDERAHSRLASVLCKTVHWYAVAAALMFACLLPIGFFFFRRVAACSSDWIGPWVLVASVACLNLTATPLFSFCEGCGMVPQVAFARLLQSIVGSLLGWGSLLVGCGLYAPGATILGQLLVALFWLMRRERLLVGLYRLAPGGSILHWRTEVWPFQWRIAISWVSGYFIFQLFNPVIFAYQGAVAAGQMGMSLTLSTALTTIAISWVNTKAAPFGGMVERREFARLDAVFFRALWQSLALSVCGAASIWLGALLLRWYGVALAQRVLPPVPLAFLLIASVVNHAVFAEATYLRAHKQEVFLAVSVVNAVCMALSTWLLGRAMGAWGVSLGYMLVTVLISFPMSVCIFTRMRRNWHTATEVA